MNALGVTKGNTRISISTFTPQKRKRFRVQIRAHYREHNTAING
ncbi:Uncharacterised protein [Legionella feeleii]|uniref:Uncharacterized protein n=1 Tax=Legionella feeleii TaxID=453 RepID=A0A378KNA9_9GAMM|nr:Uncharacterised protein [Legionella feeleii]